MKYHILVFLNGQRFYATQHAEKQGGPFTYGLSRDINDAHPMYSLRCARSRLAAEEARHPGADWFHIVVT